ncbi:MAG: hypothetical protein LBL74_04685 [Bacteroidales bacterium]|nr:hypothetical protein [Bacteroidales bacterium]
MRTKQPFIFIKQPLVKIKCQCDTHKQRLVKIKSVRHALEVDCGAILRRYIS